MATAAFRRHLAQRENISWTGALSTPGKGRLWWPATGTTEKTNRACVRASRRPDWKL